MLFRVDGGSLFIAIVGLSNVAHRVPVGPGLNTDYAMPVKNHDELKNSIKLVCEQIESLELVSSLASARAFARHY